MTPLYIKGGKTKIKIFGIFLYLSIMGNIIKLTESDLIRIINRVISEEKNDNIYDFIIDYITNQLSGLKKDKLDWVS